VTDDINPKGETRDLNTITCAMSRKQLEMLFSNNRY